MRKIISFVLFVASVSLPGCERKDVEEPDTRAIVCGTYTKIGNMIPCLGCASEDEEALYFPVLEGDMLNLVRESKQSGERTVLDAVPKPASGKTDFTFQLIQAWGDYVYYMPFDTSDPDHRKYKIWRVRKDGSERSQISAPDERVYEFYIVDDRIHCSGLFDTSGLYTCALDGSDRALLTDREIDLPICCGERYYYTYYTTYPELRLASCRMDGSDERILLEAEHNIRYVIGNDRRLYVAAPALSGWILLSMNLDGGDVKTLLKDFPDIGYLNSLDGRVFLSVQDDDDPVHGAGIYRYYSGQLTRIVRGAVLNFSLLDAGRIIYRNAEDPSCGRLGASYMTDVRGGSCEKL